MPSDVPWVGRWETTGAPPARSSCVLTRSEGVLHHCGGWRVRECLRLAAGEATSEAARGAAGRRERAQGTRERSRDEREEQGEEGSQRIAEFEAPQSCVPHAEGIAFASFRRYDAHQGVLASRQAAGAPERTLTHIRLAAAGEDCRVRAGSSLPLHGGAQAYRQA